MGSPPRSPRRPPDLRKTVGVSAITVVLAVALVALSSTRGGGHLDRFAVLWAAGLVGLNVLMWGLIGLAAAINRHDRSRLLRGNPPRIRLVRCQAAEWKDPDGVRALVEPLRSLGFRDAGLYEVAGVPGMRVQALIRPEQGVTASVLEQRASPRPQLRLTTLYEDGRKFSAFNSADGAALPRPSGDVVINDPGRGAEDLYRRFLDERPDAPMRAPSAEGFAPGMEKAHAEYQDWVAVRGGYTPEELLAHFRAARLRAGPLAAKGFSENLARLVRPRRTEALFALLASRGGRPLEEWERLRPRLIVIDDRSGPAEAIAAFRRAQGGGSQAGADDTPGADARSVFALLNQGVPEGRQLPKVGELDDPIGVDVYLAPEGVEVAPAAV
jgi:hypothetical protein